VAFANTGPNTRSTEIYINTGDNTRNDHENGFAPFGRVVAGMDTVEHLYGGYGEHSGGGMRAGHQDAMFQGGNAWLDKNYPKLDKLIRAALVR
jgi:homoserine O-acetyltransferase